MQRKKANKLLIGITGGIASGKSTVSRLFELLSIPIYFSDIRAKEIIRTNLEVKEAIIAEFGQESYSPQGVYNVPYISKIVFNDNEKLERLNTIVHPAVFQDQNDWFSRQYNPFSIIESALLFEANRIKDFDKIIVVAADDKLRIDRLVNRDAITSDQAKQRIDSQIPQAIKVQKADYVIWNNGEDSIIKQVITLSKELNDLANKGN